MTNIFGILNSNYSKEYKRLNFQENVLDSA